MDFVMELKDYAKSIIKVDKFNNEEMNRVAGIINNLGIVLIAALLIVTLQRIIFDNLNFVSETSVAIIFLVIALITIRYGKLDLAACLVIYPMYAMIVYLVLTNYGMHDSALLGIPGLLVIAGLMFRKNYFYFYSVVCLVTIVLIGMAEINGILVNQFSYSTKLFDIVDMLVIITATAIGIKMFSERLTKSLKLAYNNERAIQASQQKVHALLSALPDLVVRMGSDGVFKDFSAPNTFPMLYESKEFIGKNISELFPHDIAAKTMKTVNDAIENNSVEQFEYRLDINKGAADWEARVASIDGKDVIMVIRDISNRKRIEEALVLSEEIFKSFMEHSPIYVFFKDQNVRAIRLSKNYEEMLGMPLEQLLGKNMFELFPSELAKSMTEDDMKILNQGQMVKVQEELNGRTYETIKFPISIQNQPKYLAGFTIEITDTINNEMRLKQYADELKEANTAKEKFFSIIAHDLRSPFLGILGSIQMLTTEYNILTEEERKLLIERIGSSIRKTFELLENLLHWSRMQSGKIIPTPADLFLNKEVSQVIQLLKEFAMNKNVDLSFNINSGHQVRMDADMLKTIMRNLVSNAIKFSIPGGRINVSSEERDGEILIMVTDTGIGMDAETLDNLFKIDKTQSQLGTSNEVGTGIGLIVCREMVELNKGKVWAESREGAGSTFYLSLPKVI
jgi:PAS domain S-box-containing protein